MRPACHDTYQACSHTNMLSIQWVQEPSGSGQTFLLQLTPGWAKMQFGSFLFCICGILFLANSPHSTHQQFTLPSSRICPTGYQCFWMRKVRHTGDNRHSFRNQAWFSTPGISPLVPRTRHPKPLAQVPTVLVPHLLIIHDFFAD